MAKKNVNATAAALLGLLHDGPMTGGQLIAEANRRLGPFWSMTRSQVYRELPALAEEGYVKVGKPGPRASVPYKITATGKKAFARWMGEETAFEQLRNPVALRTAFSDHLSPGEVKSMYESATEYHKNALNEVRSEAKERGEDPHSAAALEFAVGYHKAALAWLKSVA
ncbi:PadR family transcriptional regulator [Actinorhabdospora filicis]|uniref:PadR family transcriptional regulator n=1 Tax=Actinorhabdospora filicis TaxID=1785913 RepID=A0A9W6W923_9ACTN|nr:PadR family transcriptional regulator [Actinorhabdospora filicis]GLZ76235.1 PadR family transcriptional regulator [Actinorhabdospora filicis]